MARRQRGDRRVLILDENGDNDLARATTQTQSIVMGTADPGELVKLVDVDLSGNAAPPCLDVTLDCQGPDCTTIEPVTSCAKKLPGCGGAAFCQ